MRNKQCNLPDCPKCNDAVQKYAVSRLPSSAEVQVRSWDVQLRFGVKLENWNRICLRVLRSPLLPDSTPQVLLTYYCIINASLWLRTHTALSFYLQEYNNPNHLPLRTTALTQIDGDIRARAHKLCCEYLRGAWKRTTAQDFVIRKIRYVCAPHVITDLFSLRTKVKQNCMQASSLSEASLRISKFGSRWGPKSVGCTVELSYNATKYILWRYKWVSL